MKKFESATQEQVAKVRKSPGRLLCVTATGPVYIGQRAYAVVPIASVFALLQELALRVDDKDAYVQSSLANRVSGESAHRAWMRISVECAMQLEQVTIRGRLRFLSIILSAIRRSGKVDGLETILTSAINSVWPWMSRQTTNDVLELTSRWLNKSRFAEKHSIAVVDLVQRSAGLFSAGAITKLDLAEWRTARDLQIDGAGTLPGNVGEKLKDGFKSPFERAIDELFGHKQSDGSDFFDSVTSKDSSGVPGGLPSLGDLPGQNGTSSSNGHQTPEEIAKGLIGDDHQAGVPGGLPDIGDLPGAKAPTSNNSNGTMDKGRSLLDSVPGNEYRGVSGFLRKHGPGGFKTGMWEDGTPGGPFAPTGQLGINGSGGATPGEDKVATGVLGLSGIVIAIGLAQAASISIPVSVGVAAVAGSLAAGYFIGDGLADIVYGPRPEPPKEKPHTGDLYPDPLGDGGGGGNPKWLPAYDGEGGGGPTMLPDYDGHGGGTPNTIWGKTTEGASIWDDNFGGPGPTVRPPSFIASALVGPGLMVDIMQVGPNAIRF